MERNLRERGQEREKWREKRERERASVSGASSPFAISVRAHCACPLPPHSLPRCLGCDIAPSSAPFLPGLRVRMPIPPYVCLWLLIALHVCVSVFACVCGSCACGGVWGFGLYVCVFCLFAGVPRVSLLVLFVCMFFVFVFLPGVVVTVVALTEGFGPCPACHM